MSRNPDMEEGLAFALATQQSHALGKSPKSYGTEEGRSTAKKKYKDPKVMKKTAFVEALPSLTGLATGYGPGRGIAGNTAAVLAPEGRVHRSDNMARNLGAVAVPVGGLVAMGLTHHKGLAGKLGKLVEGKFPRGLIADPNIEQELVRVGTPAAAAMGGSLAGGALMGGLVGGIQRLRGPLGRDKEASIDMGATMFTLTKSAFNTNQYSGVMNPPSMVYASGIPGFQEPPVKTAGPPPPEEDEPLPRSKMASALEQLEERELHGPGIRVPNVVLSAVEDGVRFGRRYVHAEDQEKTGASGMFTPMSQLGKAKSVGLPKVTTPPGPSIAQISKPTGFGRPISGAAKGNNII
jgi:hypothetical protein